ncbi:MAG TPA: class I SAM-dependent methyltransferase [Bryobacteraceae bacterium]|nr:class I SAM-dependent methyltransferase [Bryobacteraceae bacterium]
MPESHFVSPYDAIAALYHRAWDDWYLPAALPALERLFFSELAPGARVLDACCGSGHVTRELVIRGYDVTGLDSSASLIAHARQELPEAKFIIADVRDFSFSEPFNGALSTFDSLNHLLTYTDLCAAFRCVRRTLCTGAPFFFDMNLEEAYEMDLGEWMRCEREGYLGFTRGIYSRATHRARTEIVWFERQQAPTSARNRDRAPAAPMAVRAAEVSEDARLSALNRDRQGADPFDETSGLWRRRDAVVEEQCYTVDEIDEALRRAGFGRIERFSALQAGVTHSIGYGRVFIRAFA